MATRPRPGPAPGQLNASPYSRGRGDERRSVLAERVAETGAPSSTSTRWAARTSWSSTVRSLVIGDDGHVVAAAGQFVEELLLVDVDVHGPATEATGTGAPTGVSATSRRGRAGDRGPGRRPARPRGRGLRGAGARHPRLRGKNGFTDAVIGLSGGIDSSLVAAIAVDALGPEHVHGVTDAVPLLERGLGGRRRDPGRHLGIELATAADRGGPSGLCRACSTRCSGGEPEGLTDENLQSRLRGVLLMALSNAKGWIVLTTGNKSEMATGYSTLYGDSAGGFAVIKDVPKTLVYDLCRYRNRRAGLRPHPRPVLTKAPSAELRPDQRDDESLPPYSVLDPVVAGYVEGDRSPDDLIAAGYDPEAVARVVGLVDRAEYKRRQMPPGVRISAKAFGKDRRMPITNHYRSGRSRPRPGSQHGETPAVV